MILAATSWPDVALGFLTLLGTSVVPLAWGVLAHRKKRLELAERELELAAERAEHKKTKVEMQALTTRRLARLEEEDNQVGA